MDYFWTKETRTLSMQNTPEHKNKIVNTWLSIYTADSVLLVTI